MPDEVLPSPDGLHPVGARPPLKMLSVRNHSDGGIAGKLRRDLLFWEATEKAQFRAGSENCRAFFAATSMVDSASGEGIVSWQKLF
jgi:hypothetical protein